MYNEIIHERFKIDSADSEVVEFELFSTDNSIKNEIDSRLEQLQIRIDSLDEEINRLTSTATHVDLFVPIASGIITGVVDILYVGELNIDIENGVDFDTRGKGAETVNRFIMDFAKKNGWNGSKDSNDSKLSNAINHLERKFTMAQDDYKGFSSSKLHHLEDLAHHPTPIGLISALIVTFFKVGIFSNKDGKIKLMPIKTSKKDLLITWAPIIIAGVLYWMSCWASRKFSEKELSEFPKWQRLLIKTFCASPIFFAIGKVAINWAGHLVSDMGGSKNSRNAGAGIPGFFISLLKELSLVPPLNSTSLPEDLSNLYSKKHTDFRSELLPVKESLGKQIIPVILNELIVSTFYFVSRLKQQYDECGGWHGIQWKKTIPYGNRTIARMRTISSGVFTAVDMTDAAVRSYMKSGGNWTVGIMQFALRVNIIGLGKFAINLGNDVSMGLRRGKLRNIRINVMAERLSLTHAKLYILENDTWVIAQESQRSLDEFQTNVNIATRVSGDIMRQSVNDFEQVKKNLSLLSLTDTELSSKISNYL